MNFSKPIPEMESELAREVGRILKKADRPEQCARWFTSIGSTQIYMSLSTAFRERLAMTAISVCSTLTRISLSTESLMNCRGYFKSDRPMYSFGVQELEQEEEQQEVNRPRFHR